MEINTVTLSGRFTRDARFVNDAKKLIVFSMAVNKSVKNKSGEWETKTMFIDMKSFRALDYIEKYGKKGVKATIVGELDMENWETKEGEKRNKLSVIVNSIDFEYKNIDGDDSSTDDGKEEKKTKKTVDDNLPF